MTRNVLGQLLLGAKIHEVSPSLDRRRNGAGAEGRQALPELLPTSLPIAHQWEGTMTSGTTRNAVALPIIAKLLPDRVDRISCQVGQSSQATSQGRSRSLPSCRMHLVPLALPSLAIRTRNGLLRTACQVKAQNESQGQESHFLESQ